VPRGPTVRLAVWSGPRNLSTALMRCWENRPDTIVVDEPLYAHYLAATGLDHPGRDEVIAVGETDWRRVVAGLAGPVPDGIRVQYQKQMAHHLLPEIDRDWVAGLTNVMLIRDPREVVASYVRARESVAADEIGLPQQVALYDDLAGAGPAPPVIDARDFLGRPEAYLRALCDHAGVPFTDRMLSWPPGPRPSDGVWGRHWYAAVWRSTGFGPPGPTAPPLSGRPAAVAEQCRPLYEQLHRERWVL
jgi:Sulfotransferase domain